jgi:hypothetical protein
MSLRIDILQVSLENYQFITISAQFPPPVYNRIL